MRISLESAGWCSLLCTSHHVRERTLALPWFLRGFVIGIVVSIIVSIFFGATDNPIAFAIFYSIPPASIGTIVFWFIG
jgi:hypothetical protein